MNQELLNKIDNSITSVLWISSTEFNSSISNFKEFNYLMNGILEKKKDNLEGLYQTTSFNRPLNIALIKKSSEQSSVNACEPIISILKNLEKSNILIVHEDIEDKLIEKFKKKYKGHNFINYLEKGVQDDE